LTDVVCAVVRFVSCSTLYGGTLVENPEADIMVGLIDAEGSGGLTSEDYDVKMMAAPTIVARSIIFNVAEGLHVSFHSTCVLPRGV
jgi:hypothetical protein